MSNLNNDVGRFFICCLIVILVSNIAVAFGIFFLIKFYNHNFVKILFKFKVHLYLQQHRLKTLL